MRFLCISDIHGHAAALRRVLEDAEAREFHQLVVCGDSLFPGPAPLETWKILIERRALCVQGLSDRALYEVNPSKLKAATSEQHARIQRLTEVQRELGELIIARLGKLPTIARLPLETGEEALVVHGSPADPTEAMCADMDDAELSALMGDDPADIVICGASHVPFGRQVGDVKIVNVGSVGESPAAGFAHATIIDASAAGVSIEQFDVEL
jgi:predicted phosphodiesterase